MYMSLSLHAHFEIILAVGSSTLCSYNLPQQLTTLSSTLVDNYIANVSHVCCMFPVFGEIDIFLPFFPNFIAYKVWREYTRDPWGWLVCLCQKIVEQTKLNVRFTDLIAPDDQWQNADVPDTFSMPLSLQPVA